MKEKTIKKSHIKMTTADRIYNVIVAIFAVMICVAAFYPLWYVLIASVSKPFYVSDGSVALLPVGFTLASYKQAFSNDGVWRGYANTTFITVVGVVVNMFLSVTLAYALSKKTLPCRKFFTLLVTFTMWFSAGMIPLL